MYLAIHGHDEQPPECARHTYGRMCAMGPYWRSEAAPNSSTVRGYLNLADKAAFSFFVLKLISA